MHSENLSKDGVTITANVVNIGGDVVSTDAGNRFA